MARLIIEENTPQARQFVEFARTLPFVKFEEEKKRAFHETVEACNGIDSREFFAEVRRRINEQYDKLENA